MEQIRIFSTVEIVLRDMVGSSNKENKKQISGEREREEKLEEKRAKQSLWDRAVDLWVT